MPVSASVSNTGRRVRMSSTQDNQMPLEDEWFTRAIAWAVLVIVLRHLYSLDLYRFVTSPW